MFLIRKMERMQWFAQEQREFDQIILSAAIIFLFPFAMIEFLIEFITYPIWRPIVWAFERNAK